MTLHHDIAKPETLTRDERGYTQCPGHEEKGAIKAQRILDRFDLSNEEKKHILQMIQVHGVFCYTQHQKNPEEDYAVLQKSYPSMYLDMLLFELADTKALKVSQDGKNLQNEMISFYERKIEEYFTHS
jgi:membrane carboxypeptidase/penicillin-binding protein PbpC